MRILVSVRNKMADSIPPKGQPAKPHQVCCGGGGQVAQRTFRASSSCLRSSSVRFGAGRGVTSGEAAANVRRCGA